MLRPYLAVLLLRKKLLRYSLFFLQIMLRLKEAGITIWHLRDVIRRRNSFNLRQLLIEHDRYDGSVQVLGLTPLAAGYSLLLVGASIAGLVFYLELTRAAGSTSIRDVRRSIASNHAGIARSTAEKGEQHRNDPKRDVPNMFSSRFPSPSGLIVFSSDGV